VSRYLSPYPYFGGKSRIAPQVWQRFGRVTNYVEPFFGSGAMLLARPDWPECGGVETVNDADGFICNFWRAVQADPEAVACYADWPAIENDLHARHVWLKTQRGALTARLEGDPDYYDAKIAGWWVWGMSQWIGTGFCADSGDGPWHVVDGKLVKREKGEAKAAEGVRRKLPHLGDAGRGISRQLLHLGDAGQGVKRYVVTQSQGGSPGTGACGLYAWMEALSERLARVRVACGDWSRVMGPSVTEKHGTAAIFLDPPYSAEAGRDMGCYHDDDGTVARAVRDWCLANGDKPGLRIALCGYEGEHEALEAEGWSVLAWSARGGMALQGQGRGRKNRHRERVWFSPHCLTPAQRVLAQGVLEFE
jgi:hypothetical protein